MGEAIILATVFADDVNGRTAPPLSRSYTQSQIVPSVGDAVTEEIGSSPRITAFFLEFVRVASCRGVSLAL